MITQNNMKILGVSLTIHIQDLHDKILMKEIRESLDK